MTNRTAAIMLGAAALVGAARADAPAQTYPGQPTQGKVWIQNRGKDEAVPIDLQHASLDVPLRVEVVDPFPGRRPLFDVHYKAQPWEYRVLQVNASDTAQVELNRFGEAGWEVVGQLARANGFEVLLKRPR